MAVGRKGHRFTQALLAAAAAAAILPVIAGSSTGNVPVDITLAMPGAGGPAGAFHTQNPGGGDRGGGAADRLGGGVLRYSPAPPGRLSDQPRGAARRPL